MNIKYWQRFGEGITFMYCWKEKKSVNIFLNCNLAVARISITQDLEIPLLSISLDKTPTHGLNKYEQEHS